MKRMITISAVGFLILSMSLGVSQAAPENSISAANVKVNNGEQQLDNLHRWNAAEKDTLRRLSIDSLTQLPPDPTNAVGDNKMAGVMGKKIFFDKRFSKNGKVSCATCHDPEHYFTDGLSLSNGVGQTRRNAPSLVGVAYGVWFFWDGRSDSQWSQALGPLENGVEHGGNRTQYAHLIHDELEYRRMYESVFGEMPDISDRVRFPDNAGPVSNEDAANAWRRMAPADQKTVTRIFTNIGKVIAAFERQLKPGKSRFDDYVKAVLENDTEAMKTTLNEAETAGLHLFIGKANCAICHTGPLFTNFDFKNIAVPKVKKLGSDYGRFNGVQKVQESEFNCLGEYSDAAKSDCAELQFIKFTRDDTVGAFKVPGLRNVAQTAPYMHAGQFKDLKEVLKHYQKRPRSRIGHSDLLPTKLTDDDLVKLEAFLHTLTSVAPIASQ